MKIERLALGAMGTRFELVLVDAGGQARFLRAAGEAALEVIAECERRWSAFARDSLLARIGRAAGPTRVDPQTYALLAATLELWERTGGAFDPCLGGAMERLGFRGPTPGGAAVAPAGEDPPLELDERAQTVRVRPGARLDLGGVAKGCALDLAAAELREGGVDCALLHGGTSSVVALGAPPIQDPIQDPGATRAVPPAWRVAVVDPLAGSGGALTVLLTDRSMSVSAPHGRTVAEEGAEAARGHVVDPRTGTSVELGRVACVVASSGLEADGLATALVVGGSGGQNAASPASLLRPGDAAALAAGAASSRRWELFGAHAQLFETPTH